MKKGYSAAEYKISEQMSERIRILRAIFIIMVVFIHSTIKPVNFKESTAEFGIPQALEMLQRFISSGVSCVAVPGFFLFSGILLYQKPFTWAGNMRKKLRTLVLPYILCNSIWIAAFFLAQLFPFTSVFFSQKKNIIANWGLLHWINAFLPLNIFEGEYPFLYPFWYIHNLILLNFLAISLKKIMDRFPKIFLAFLVCLWILPTSGWLRLYKQSIVFFCLGYYFVKYHITFQTIDEKVNFKLLSFLYFLLLCIYSFFHIDSIGFVSLRYLIVLAGLLFWTHVSAYLKKGKFLTLLADYQFIIYGFHEFTLTIFKKIIVHIFPQTITLQCVLYLVLPFLSLLDVSLWGVFYRNYFLDFIMF